MHLYHGRANAIHPYNNLLTQNKDVHCNPRNPVNPDSKLIFTGIVIWRILVTPIMNLTRR
jgi:hypothetical protein